MRLQNISKDELETMNYDDIAYIILDEEKAAMKINILFKKVCDALELTEKQYEEQIADFFALLTTDKRFIMLEDGSWDLKELHNPKVIVEDEDEEDTIINDIDDSSDNAEEKEEDIFYENDSDDDIADDELEDLVVIDVDDEEDPC